MARLFGPWRHGPRSHHVGMHPTRAHDIAAPALVVIGGGVAVPARAQAPSIDALVAACPAAQQALFVGAAADDGAAAYRERHPGSTCTTVEARCAAIEALHGAFDLIVLPEGLAALDAPQAALDALASIAAPRATLMLEQPQHATLAMLQRWAEADLTDDDGALSAPHLALGSLASCTKALLDAGWMPTLLSSRPAPPVSAAFETAAVAMAGALGIPATTARRQWGARSHVIQCERSFEAAPAASGPSRFTVVVPTTRDRQLRANVDASPGLHEVQARVVSVRRAATPAAAMAIAAPHLDSDWVLLAHQDVYFPRGFGHRLNALLAQIGPDERPRTLMGFAGMGVDRAQQSTAKAGFVIDRTARADWGANDHAVSIDELAIVVSRDSVHRIDPALGWHLWATDLCLTAIAQHRVFPRIVRLPLFHNSSTDHTLPDAFFASAATLAAKHPGWGPIHTLCGVIDARFHAQRRAHTA